MTTKHDITIPQASTWQLVVTISGGPETIDGYEGSMQVRKTKVSEAVLADVNPARFTITDSTRQVVLTLTDEDTAAYAWSGTAFYDLYIEGPEGDRWRVIEGLATLSKTVTQEEI
jgi:hypothetical protein